MLKLIVHDRLITVHNVEACIDGNLVDVADIVGPEVGLAHSDILLHLLVLLLVVQLNLGVGGGVTLDAGRSPLSPPTPPPLLLEASEYDIKNLNIRPLFIFKQ